VQEARGLTGAGPPVQEAKEGFTGGGAPCAGG